MQLFPAPVAQLDRASDFGSEGWGFESLPAHRRTIGVDDVSNAEAEDPVEGVTLEQYTKAAVAVYGLGEVEAEEAARAHGIPAGRMQTIGEEWSRRMTTHP